MQVMVDQEMEIDPKLFKEGLKNKSVGLRAKDYTKQVRRGIDLGVTREKNFFFPLHSTGRELKQWIFSTSLSQTQVRAQQT